MLEAPAETPLISAENKLTAVKSLLGETYGAGGAANLLSALLSMKNREIAPTSGFQRSNYDFINKTICKNRTEFNPGNILINSFGLGYYSSIIIRPTIATMIKQIGTNFFR